MDYSDISIYPPKKYNGIIVLRVHSQAKQHVINVFQRLIQTIGIEPLIKCLWIVEENVIRIRGEEK